MFDRLKRLIAFVIDWNILLLPALIVASLVSRLMEKPGMTLTPIWMLLFVVAVLGSFAMIPLRDIIFCGRSLGKRIFGLYVVDKKTLEPISKSRRFVRTIFFFLINWVEIILLLATGETLGDRVAAAQVLSKKTMESRRAELMAEQEMLASDPGCTQTPTAAPAPGKPTSKKQVILVVGILLVALLAFVGIVQISLHSARNTEEARLAYAYVTESEAFAASGIKPSALRMNQYSRNSFTENGVTSTTAEISFTARFRTFRVVCHKENDVWTVCGECTAFR